jgi:hypothetical protein
MIEAERSQAGKFWKAAAEALDKLTGRLKK